MATYLEIIGIDKSGADPSKESVHIKYIHEKSLNLKWFGIYDKTFANGKESNINVHFLRFPDIQASKDDIIHVHTGKGETVKKGNQIFIFTGTDQPHWNEEGDTITVIHFEICDAKKLTRKSAAK